MSTHDNEIPTGLSAILYGLYHVENIEKDEFYKKLAEYADKNLDEGEKQEYKQALDWVRRNPAYDFNTILPNLRKTNEQIRIYIEKYRQFSRLFDTK